MPADPYAESGEFIDVLSQDAWRALGAPISDALRQAAPGQGPIVDIGAGTGLGTLLVADTVPDAEVIAVEPSPILRAVLLSRLAANDGLRRRVTVQAIDVDGMRLPPRLGGVLAINMIGHLTPAQRRRFWADLRPRLEPAAPLIVNLQPPTEPTVIPESPFTSVPIGRRTYQGSGGARPAGDDMVTWTMRYRILDEDGAVDSEFVAEYPWHVLSPQDLLDELTAAGYAATARELDVVVALPRT
ncbi:class I SAM-dependent methyltransferase [Phytohabitans sp. LJ34]|uniref:class I SAM-dependent methyltransferase n=1 Tax=Phytohabitans sp. LJ34 TaxID=3452217 RepID=UPI003F8B21D8